MDSRLKCYEIQKQFADAAVADLYRTALELEDPFQFDAMVEYYTGIFLKEAAQRGDLWLKALAAVSQPSHWSPLHPSAVYFYGTVVPKEIKGSKSHLQWSGCLASFWDVLVPYVNASVRRRLISPSA